MDLQEILDHKAKRELLVRKEKVAHLVPEDLQEQWDHRVQQDQMVLMAMMVQKESREDKDL